MTRIAEIEERVEKATKGPWFAADDGIIWHEMPMEQTCCGQGVPVINHDLDGEPRVVGEECCGQPEVSGGQEAIGQSSGDNATLIANAPADLAYLLAENKRLREGLESIARQKLDAEMDEIEVLNADYIGGYDECVKTARAALQE